MPRILFITHYTNLHGANRSLLGLIEGLAGHGVVPFVVAPDYGPITERLSELAVPFRVLPMSYWMSRSKVLRWSRLARNLLAVPTLARLARREKIDLVYTNSSCTPVGAWLARLTGRPHIWHVREFGELDFGLKHDWGKRVFDLGMASADHVITISESVRKSVLSGLPRCQVIRNGVISRRRLASWQESRRAQAADREPGSFVFALVGQFNSNKNQLQAIEAMEALRSEFPKARLLLAGDDRNGYGRKLKQVVHEKGLNNQVEFLGYVSDPFEVFARADASLMCSRHEALGRVTCEAMVAGLPVIGADNGGTAELIRHEENGLLYDGSLAGLIRCMRRLLAGGSGKWAGDRSASREALDEFTHEACAAQVARLIDLALNPERVRT